MDIKEAKQQVADTGRLLLSKELVARTWGNISARVDKTRFAISPSGLGYENMTESDVPVYDYIAKTYEGSRKPSSEKKIHAAAYDLYEDVNFVIHTHQDYATVIGLVGTKDLKMTPEEEKLLGPIEVASYGLPGTKTLKKNVEAALKRGSKIVLMIHHGAVILGSDRDDAITKAEVLEAVCKRTVEEKLKPGKACTVQSLSPEMLAACKDLVVVETPDLLAVSEGKSFRPQLDDIAQMVGKTIYVVKNDDRCILNALNKADAIIVEGVGGVILTEEPDDAAALKLLISKSATAKRYTELSKVKCMLSAFDCLLMRFVYKKKYSKQKKG